MYFHFYVIFVKNIIQTFPTLEQSEDLIFFFKENERPAFETVTEILKKKKKEIVETPPNNSI